MLKSNTFLTYLLTMLVSLTLTACPDDECETETAGDEAADMAADDLCEEEGGDIAGETAGETAGEAAGETAGEAAGEETPVVEYNFVVVKDTTTGDDNINGAGTPGVDICDVAVTCDGEAVITAEEIYISRGSEDCDGDNSEDCLCRAEEIPGVCGGTDRSNKDNVFDEDVSCEGDSYTSLGIDGSVAVEFTGLNACAEVSVSVTEKVGDEDESFVAGLCQSADVDLSDMMLGDACAEIVSNSDGGVADFTWSNPNAGSDDTEDDSEENSEENSEEE